MTDDLQEMQNAAPNRQEQLFKSQVELFFTEFTDCQKVSPYGGWDLDKLKEGFGKFLSLGEKTPQFHDGPITHLYLYFAKALLSSRTITGGWNITALNRLSNVIRAHLDLPSIRELNPDIAKMQDAAKRPEAQSLMKRFGGVT